MTDARKRRVTELPRFPLFAADETNVPTEGIAETAEAEAPPTTAPAEVRDVAIAKWTAQRSAGENQQARPDRKSVV